jgi:hypothetical protein
MNVKSVASALLIGLGWACAVAQGQQTEMPAPGTQPPPIRSNGDATAPLPPGAAPWAPAEPGLSGLSDWILYRRPSCCSAGPCWPLFGELYLRVGPSIPFGGHFLGRELIVGWTLEGGVRGLFFNQEMTSAWVIDAGIVNSNNGALSPGTPTTLNIFLPNGAGGVAKTKKDVTIQDYNRTFVSLGLGKEWYLWEPANAPGCKWRVGFDSGGRWGTSSMTFHEIRHRTNVIYGSYLALHTDLEVPCSCCTLLFGARCEWAYTWNSILQRISDNEEVNFLLTFGVRY